MTSSIQLTEAFFPDFCRKYRIEKAKLPYSINILDELHGNENFHSRLLTRLLSLQIGSEFPILSDFFKTLGSPFNQLSTNSPWISAEADRIDARIRLTDGVVIIENKVHGAVEQPNQVDRYIQNEMDAKYDISKIYVLYLTRSGGTASVNSLSSENRSRLDIRYKDISFQSDILPWLQSLSKNLLPKLDPIITRQMQAALVQYIDHLHGLFFEREGEAAMKNEMIRFLGDELRITSQQAPSERFGAIQQARQFAQELFAYLEEYENSELFKALAALQEQIRVLGSELDHDLEFPERFGEKYSQIFMRPKQWSKNYAIGFSFDEKFAKFFYGIRDFRGNATEELQKRFTDIFLPERNAPNSTWPLGIWIQQPRIDAEFLAQIEDGRFLRQFTAIVQNIESRVKDMPEIHSA